jgi:microcystin-dependent protein
MATVVTYKPERVQEIVDGTVMDGTVNAGRLMLEYRDGDIVDAGGVMGPQGFQGPGHPLNGAQIALYAGTVAPLGWLFCDGSPVSRANFPELFAQIGTTYGAGDASGTTFNLPDFRGRVAVGLDAAQTEFNALAKTGGEKKHTLTIEEMPSHTHTVYGYSSKDDENFTGNVGRLNAADTFGQNNTTYDKETLSNGVGSAHNNLQPYNTINYIIATGTSTLGLALAEGGGIAAPRYYTSADRGTTAQRDAKFGVPGTAGARVALANQQVTWFNTDLGWKERYYEVTGSAGLTAVGLVAGATPGWYPIGVGPYLELDAPAEVNVFIDTVISGWSILYRKGGASWFTMTGTDRANVLKHGRYDIKVWTNQYGGNTATPDYALKIFAADNVTEVRNVGGGAFTKHPGFMTKGHAELYDQILAPNQKVLFKLQRGTIPGGETNMPVHTGGPDVIRGRLSIKYVSPPLSDIQT